MQTKAIVKAEKQYGVLVYKAGRYSGYSGRLTWLPLLWNDEDEVTFETFEAAEKLVREYNDPPGEYDPSIVSCRWDSNEGRWEIEYE